VRTLTAHLGRGALSRLRVPTRGDVPASVKAALLIEILATYAVGLRHLRGGDLRAMAGWSRSTSLRVRHAEAGAERDLALRLGSYVGRILRVLPTDSRCLIRSLVTVRVLQRRGIESRLAIGVRPGPPFEAHAWVEHEGRPVLPQQDFPLLLQV
jgi:hypothetical protein